MSYVMFGIACVISVCWLFFYEWLDNEGYQRASLLLTALVVLTVWFTSYSVERRCTMQKVQQSLTADASTDTNEQIPLQVENRNQEELPK